MTTSIRTGLAVALLLPVAAAGGAAAPIRSRCPSGAR
jgi:hypothetical protein